MANLPINGLDLAVGIILLISALLAFMRGFVHEVLSVAAWVGAVLAGVHGLPFARPIARKFIPIDWAADSAAAVLIFLVVLLALSILTNAIARSIQKSALNNLDRSLGFVFGLARAVLILGVGLMVVDWLTDRDRPVWVRTAKTLPIIESAATGIKSLVPPSFLSPGMAPSEVAKEALKKANAASDTQKTFDRLAAPAAATEKDAEGETTYQKRERQDMEHLLQSTTGAAAPDARPAAEKPPEGSPHE